MGVASRWKFKHRTNRNNIDMEKNTNNSNAYDDFNMSCKTPNLPDANIDCISPSGSLPWQSLDEFASWLVASGLLDEMAWFDPDGWDGGSEKDRVCLAWNKLKENT